MDVESSVIRDTNPQHWKVGFLYYDSPNPRLFAPKKMTGLPLTLNFAHSSAWVLSAVIIASFLFF